MRYQRLMPLGSGGMANVHLSLAVGHSGFKRLVVVKSVREELLGDAATRQMFLAEARLSARLNHPNVVQVSEVLETHEGAMLVMEYLDGLAFSAACRAAGDSLTLTMRLRILCDVLSGLAYAHDLCDYHGEPLGIVHRDVSAQNVFVTFDGRVKLLDFGIAKVTSSPDRTRTGVIKGRVAYMPVEQVTGKAVDRRTDIYAVGCLMWEAIAGSRIWNGLTEPQIVRNVLKDGLPKLGTRVEVDPELERIVGKATAQAADDRYADARELRLELEAYLRSQPAVSLREIGELLSVSCSEARAEKKRALALAISNAERDLVTQGIDVDGTSQQRLRVTPELDDAGNPTSVSSRRILIRSMSPTPQPYFLTPSPEPTPASRPTPAVSPPRSRRPWIWIALGMAATLVVVAWAPSLLQQPSQPGVAAGPAVSAAPVVTRPVDSAPAEAASTSVEDAKTASPNAPGSAKSRHVRVRGGVAAAKPAAAAPGGARPGCDPPYYFSAGIKTYKPECI
jgi:eukaryotic-like serine/threonine-protein kinase